MQFNTFAEAEMPLKYRYTWHKWSELLLGYINNNNRDKEISTIFTNHNSITKSILKSKFACGTTFRFYCTYSRITSLDYILWEGDDRKNWTPSTNQIRAKQCEHIASQIIVKINLDGIYLKRLRDRVKFA